MSRYLVLFFCCLISQVFARPTMEGLFRHPNNPELTGNMVILKFKISKKSDQQILEKTISEKDSKNLLASDMMHPVVTPDLYVKQIYSLERPGTVQLLQLVYRDSQMTNELIDIQYIKNLYRHLASTERKEQRFFYSLLVSLLLNESKPIAEFLKMASPEFVLNSEILNADKMKMMEEYKRYLKLIKEDEALKETLPNPLEPTEEEKKTALEEIKKQSMYQQHQALSLVRKDHRFFWKLSLGQVEGWFDNKRLNLEKIEMMFMDQSLKVECSESILFDGAHYLPREILYSVSSDVANYRIRMMQMVQFENKSNKSMMTRHKEYEKKLETLTEESPKTYYGFLM